MNRYVRAAVTNPLLLLLVGVLALAGIAGRSGLAGDGVDLDAEEIAIPVPLPIYEIEGTYAGQPLRLLNLPLAPIGIVPLPIPVDLNRDLIPDITVAVNLLNPSGLFDDPPDLGNLIAPNLEINRLLPGLPLTHLESSLRINAKLTLLDLQGAPPTILRLGYGTGDGGSVPARFKVTAAGLAGFFDPLTASVETPGYEGPLSLIAGFEQGPQRADADLRFLPLPAGLRFTYGSAADGQLIRASHGGAVGGTTPADREVDLDADIRVRDGAELATVEARVDRLPRSVDVVIAPGAEGAGGFTYQASTDGRLPDVRVDATTSKPGEPPLAARLDLEALPPVVEAAWSLADDEPAAVRLAAPERPIGAVEARVANFLGATDLPGYVPTAPQFVDLRQAADVGDESGDRLVTARVEGVSLVEFTQTEGGIDSRFASSGGGRPLELHAVMAEVGEAKRQLDATSTVSPLPRELRATLADGSDTGQPVVVRYEASDSVDVDGRLELRDDDVAATAPCGDPGTICADLDVRDIPTSIETRIEQRDAGDDPDEVRVAVDAEARLGGSPPDVFADVTFGQDDGVPLVAHAEALAIPAHLRVRAVDGADQTLARAEFHACNRDYAAEDGAGACAVNSEGEVGALAFSLRNFLGERPDGLPVLVADEANHALVAARGRPGDPDVVEFEAAGRMVGIREVRLIEEGGIALRARVGAGEPLRAAVDLAGVDLGGEGLTDLRGEAIVAAVPDTLDFCFRGTDPETELPDDPLTAPCNDANPFRDGQPLPEAPVSLAYRAFGPPGGPAADPIDVTTSVSMTDHGPTSSTDDDAHVDATLDITDLPVEATAHILAPETGPVRAVYDTGAGTGSAPTVVDFAARIADADLVCRDPRQPVPGTKVTCVSGRIDGLPTRATFEYDPDLTAENLDVTTAGEIDLRDLELSQVKGALEAGVPITEAIVVAGDILGLPAHLSGTLVVPGDEDPDDAPVVVDLTADPPIASVAATIQNFVGADSLPVAPPAQRAGLPPVDDSYDTVTLFQRGDQLRAAVEVTELAAAGYRSHVTGRKAPAAGETEGEPVTTHAVALGFGSDRRVRAYVDVDDGEEQVLADVTLGDRPADLSVCFRGERATTVTVTNPTFCDTAAGQKAAFELAGTPLDPDDALDVDAFVRVASSADGVQLSARADIDDLPPVLQGDIGNDGVVTVEGLDGQASNAGPAGVGRMDFDVATFDIAADGYDLSSRPFLQQPRATGPFAELAASIPAAPRQHLGFAADGDDHFELVGRVGGPGGSRFQSLELTNDACAVPEGRAAEYPFYPDPDGTEIPLEYTCARANLEQTGTTPDPLAISVIKDDGAERLAVRSAELSDVPGGFQVTLAKSPALVPLEIDDTEPLRARCGFADGTGNQSADCLPPQLRFDTDAGPGATLSGIVEVGPLSRFDDLAGVARPEADDLPDLAAAPSAAGWADWGTDPRGVRAAVASFEENDGSESTVARAGFRIPLPDSFTLHPVQSWNRDAETLEDFSSASDVRLGYSARIDGALVGSLGRLALLFQAAAGDHVVVTDTAEAGVLENGGGDDFTPRAATGIPGELDLTIYRRNDKRAGSQFFQVDGRVSQSTDLRARVFSAPEPPAEGDDPDPFPFPTIMNEPPEHPLRIDASILHLPGPAAGDNGIDPTFRLRAELAMPEKRLEEEPEPPPDSCPGFFSIDACTKTNIALVELNAIIDFQPFGPGPDGPVQVAEPARLVKVFGQADGESGLHIQAFNDPRAAADATPSAVVSAQAALRLAPFNISYDGQLIIFNADVDLESTFQPVLLLDRVSDFRLRAKGPRLAGENTEHLGTEGEATIIPLLDLEDFSAHIELDAWLFDITLLGVDFVGSGPVQMDYEDCSNASKFFADPIIGLLDGVFYVVDDVLWQLMGITPDARGMRFRPGTGVHDALVVPRAEDDPRFVLNVLGFPLVPDAGGALMNIFDGMILCGDAVTGPLIDAEHPGDPLLSAGHPVPDAPAGVDVDPAEQEQPEASPLTVAAGQVHHVCGRPRYTDLFVDGTLQVGGPSCPEHALAEGRYSIDADQFEIGVDGSVVLLEGSTQLTINTTNLFNEGLLQAQSGDITVVASQVVQVTEDGEVSTVGASTGIPINPDTNQPWSTDGPDGRGGGGHRGGGGADGDDNGGGGGYGNDRRTSAVTEAGGPGGGDGAGRGGGVIEIRANAIGVDGVVIADGQAGAPGECGVTGALAGGGGGAGGGITLASNSMFLEPDALFANGGPGGGGSDDLPTGAGGGGGGTIKVLTPIFLGNLPATPSGGAGGPACGTADGGDGGGGGTLVEVRTPQSRVRAASHVQPGGERTETFWHSQDAANVDLHVSAGTRLPAGVHDFNVVVCASFIPIEFADANRDGDPEGLPDGPPTQDEYLMPTDAQGPASNPVFRDPCGERRSPQPTPPPGTDGVYDSAITLTNLFVEDTQVANDVRVPMPDLNVVCDYLRSQHFESVQIDGRGLSSAFPCSEGYWGVWTRVVVSDIDGNNCFDGDDAGDADDVDHCSVVEAMPERADLVFAVDETDPTIDVPVVSGERTLEHVAGDPTRVDTALRDLRLSVNSGDQADLSRLDRLRCVELDRSTGNAIGTDCHNGDQLLELGTSSNGEKDLVVFAFDNAGNVFTEGTTVVLDRTPPSGQGVVVPAVPDGDGGWFRTAPDYRLSNPSDPDIVENHGGSPTTVSGTGVAAEPWVYRFDSGDESACASVVCVIDDGTPTRGEHTLHFSAIDRVGNRFDDVALVPGQPDLFPSPMPTVGPIRIDPEAPTSTLATAPSAPDGDDEWFRTDPFVVLSAVDQPGASGLREVRYRLNGSTTEQVFTEPFRLGAGIHSVCWYAVDVAGNAEPEQCTDPAHPIKVDTDDPTATLAVTPPTPTGGDGWYLTPPTVTATAADATPGAGVDPFALLVSFDGAPFSPFAGPMTVPEGVHRIRAYATDRSGRSSEVVEVALRVDQSIPVAAARLVPPAPARDQWYRRLPTVVLRATDGEANAGVERLEYRIDGGAFQPYTGPVELTDGIHTVSYRAVDRAGRTSPITDLSVATDDGAPIARAQFPDPIVWSRLLGPANAKLAWAVGDDQAGTVQIRIHVVDIGGTIVRRIDAGTRTVTPGVPVSGFTLWNGLTGAGQQALGTFHYRVVVTDAAGNRAQSNASRPIQVKLL